MSDWLRALARWDPPWWVKVPIGVAVFALGVTYPIAVVPIVIVCIPLVVLGVREKQRRRRDGEL